MYKLDYGTQISPSPIKLSIGTLIKPSLRSISEITFNEFNYYEILLALTPEFFFTQLSGKDGKKYWEGLSDDKYDIELYDIILKDYQIAKSFESMFNFFFMETVIFQDGLFFLLKGSKTDVASISRADVSGVIERGTFSSVINLIKQICCMDIGDSDESELKFKNSLARKMFKKMQKAENQKNKGHGNLDHTLPNIISSVSNMHPSINYTNIWDLTLFQLFDVFKRIQTNSFYQINSNRVSVWGDEKNAFDPALWYKNTYDKK